MPQSSLTAWLQKPAIAPQMIKTPSTTSLPEDQAGNKKTKSLPNKPVKAPLPSRNEPPASPVPDATTRSTTPNPWTPPPRHHPPNVSIRPCTAADIPALKRLNSLLLPLPYPESFYQSIIADSRTNNLTLLALWQDDPNKKGEGDGEGEDKGRLIGALGCRVLPESGIPRTRGSGDGDADADAGKQGAMLYLSTLALLSPYRGHGIAAHMLHTVLVRAVENYGITSVGAHVWEANEAGLEWYGKRGFRVAGREIGYYRRLVPSGAVVVRRDVRVSDLLGG